MSFTIKLLKNYSDVNVVSKSYDELADKTGVLKTSTSLINPVIEFEGSIPKDCNYMYISEFGRYYFVTDIVSTGSDRFSITGHVDVLMTYADQIKQCSGIVARQQNNWNLYLDDGTFKAYQNPTMKLKKFPSGFSTASFILAVAGS